MKARKDQTCWPFPYSSYPNDNACTGTNTIVEGGTRERGGGVNRGKSHGGSLQVR